MSSKAPVVRRPGVRPTRDRRQIASIRYPRCQICRRVCASAHAARHVPRDGSSHTLTIRLPRFSPASSPISAFGVFSRPSMTSSWTFSWPEATQPCRSASARVALLHVVHHDEALHDQPLHHDQAGHAARAVRRRRAVILRDRAAAGDAAVIVHLRQAGFEDVAADIVEIDVDALRAPRRAAP